MNYIQEKPRNVMNRDCKSFYSDNFRNGQVCPRNFQAGDSDELKFLDI